MLSQGLTCRTSRRSPAGSTQLTRRKSRSMRAEVPMCFSTRLMNRSFFFKKAITCNGRQLVSRQGVQSPLEESQSTLSDAQHTPPEGHDTGAGGEQCGRHVWCWGHPFPSGLTTTTTWCLLDARHSAENPHIQCGEDAIQLREKRTRLTELSQDNQP